MVYLKDICKSYDDVVVLNRINMSLSSGEVVGLVGENGSGKSTLLKILVGELKADRGHVDQWGEHLAYLPQFPEFGSLSVQEFLSGATKNPDLEKYQINAVFDQIGLESISLESLCAALSGGEQTKLIIASFFLNKVHPTVLVLDEPTNNLDLLGIEWLETFIKKFEGVVILTSHDRLFLDRVTTKTIELHDGNIRTYGGNYSFYRHQKHLQQEAVARQYIAQQKKIKQVREDILDYKNRGLRGELLYTSRNPYQKKKAQKASRTAVVRQKKLEKFLSSDNFIEKPIIRKKYGVRITASVPSAKLICEVDGIKKTYGTHVVLDNISLSVRGNDRLWVVGNNGSGKSTLCKIIVGELDADFGKVRFGTSVKWAYLSQKSNIDLEITGIDFLKSLCADTTTTFTTAAHLHLFEEDLSKKIRQLSQGQIAKLEFVRLLVSGSDLLILDEPTNHLEIETREDIEEALTEYKGAIIVATHDRYFIETLGITHILDLG